MSPGSWEQAVPFGRKQVSYGSGIATLLLQDNMGSSCHCMHDTEETLESEERFPVVPTMSESEEKDKSWDSFKFFISLDLTKRNVFIFFGISRHKISKKRESGCFKFKTFLV